jgi:hypothetical protein
MGLLDTLGGDGSPRAPRGLREPRHPRSTRRRDRFQVEHIGGDVLGGPPANDSCSSRRPSIAGELGRPASSPSNPRPRSRRRACSWVSSRCRPKRRRDRCCALHRAPWAGSMRSRAPSAAQIGACRSAGHSALISAPRSSASKRRQEADDEDRPLGDPPHPAHGRLVADRRAHPVGHLRPQHEQAEDEGERDHAAEDHGQRDQALLGEAPRLVSVIRRCSPPT